MEASNETNIADGTRQ